MASGTQNISSIIHWNQCDCLASVFPHHRPPCSARWRMVSPAQLGQSESLCQPPPGVTSAGSQPWAPAWQFPTTPVRQHACKLIRTQDSATWTRCLCASALWERRNTFQHWVWRAAAQCSHGESPQSGTSSKTHLSTSTWVAWKRHLKNRHQPPALSLLNTPARTSNRAVARRFVPRMWSTCSASEHCWQ